MKIPTKRLDLAEIGYEGYWVVLPRSVTEGFVYAIGHIRTGTADVADPDATAEAAERGREVNVAFLDLVKEWNLDDDEGKVLPLPSTLRGDKKAAVIAQVPVDIIRHLADQLTAQTKTPEKVKDFS